MKHARIKRLQEYIMEHQLVSLDELCKIFSISKTTIRRDVNELAKKGFIKKVYGGVTVNNNEKNRLDNLISFKDRNLKYYNEKVSIGQIAASFVEDKDIIFIDSGTTTIHIIEFLKDKKDVTILTNNINAIINSIPFPNLNVICLGGSLVRNLNSFEGINNFAMFKEYNINKAFMAATGISIANGATNSSPLENQIKKYIVSKSNKTYVLINSHKFDISSLMTYCKLAEIDCLITDAEPPQKYVDYFNENNISFIMPK